MTPRRFARVLTYAGIAGVVLGLGLVHASWLADPPYAFTGTFRFFWSLVYVVLLGVTAYGLGLPDLSRSAGQGLRTAVMAAAGGAVAISLVQLVAGDALLPRFVVFGSAILLVPWYLLCAGIADTGAAGGTARDRVLVVSDTASLTGLRHEVARGAERPVRVVGVMGVDDVGPSPDGRQPLVERVRRERATVLVVDREAQEVPLVVSQAAVVHQSGVRVRTLSLFYEEWLGKLPVSELERVSLLFDISEVHRSRYGRVKRLADVAGAALGLVGLAVLVPVVLVGNRLGNRGPLIFRQQRVGKGGRPFEMLKFRTMAPAGGPGPGTDEGGAWTTAGDVRVTRFGRILRLSHLDELPQVLNILRGELSIVGPRPEQPRYVTELVEKLPFYDLRHLVRPGLTGWAQVKYGYAADESDALEKLQYEFYYLRHQGPVLDARIVGRTIRSVLRREGR
jgi:lipopolysaccharide/colanic/teichoic acid biosynthesis glycosyltransferase